MLSASLSLTIYLYVSLFLYPFPYHAHVAVAVSHLLRMFLNLESFTLRLKVYTYMDAWNRSCVAAAPVPASVVELARGSSSAAAAAVPSVGDAFELPEYLAYLQEAVRHLQPPLLAR